MLLAVLYVIGITAEGMTAALAAGRRKMDLFGVIMIAEVTALGGGTARDVVLGHYPLTWVKTPAYLFVVAAAAIITISISKLMAYFRTLFLALDAVGLAVFTVLGMNVGIKMGYGFTISMVAAVITGVFGGIMRDIFCNRIPLVFQKELYAAVVLAGSIVFWTLRELGVNYDVVMIATLLTVFIFRMLAVRYEWALPVFEYQEREYFENPLTQIWDFNWFSRLSRVRKIRQRRADRRQRKQNKSAASGSGESDTPEEAPESDDDAGHSSH